MPHYHIRWSRKKELDWERFDTRLDAQISAAQLVRPDETYTIEEHDEGCARCVAAYRIKTRPETEEPCLNAKIRNPNLRYAWQQAVLDAFESSPDSLPLKVNAAQRAISARLTDPTPADLDERIAIREALLSLRALLPERIEREDKSGGKKEIA